MKVLAKTKDGVIVEISNTDLANLIGDYYNAKVTDSSGEIKSRSYSGFEIGDVADVAKLYSQAREIKDTWIELNKLVSQIKGAGTKFQNSVNELNIISKTEDK